MARHFKLVTLAGIVAAACATSSHAGYAQLQPPPGWSAGTGAITAQYTKAANEAWVQSTVRTNASLNVGGRAVQVPAALRLSANASRFATARIGTALAGGPAGVAVAAGLLVLPAVITWYSQQSTYTWNPDRKVFEKTGEDSNCDVSVWDGIPIGSTSNAGCGSFAPGRVVAIQNGSICEVRNTCANMAPHYGNVPLRTSPTRIDAPWPEVEPHLNPLPMPDPMPNALPWPWPVDLPLINPSPSGVPQPLFVPTADPVPNPDYDPNAAPSSANQPYLQPGVRVVPSPTTAEPWRVDVQPINRPQAGPEPVTEEPPATDPADTPKKEEQQSLCEKHPDVLACARLGNAPEAQPVSNEDRHLSIQPDTGWGEGGGSCPAPKTVQVHGFQLSMPFDLLCDFASGIRPVVIGLAWLAAAFTFMGIGRRD